LSRFNYHWVSAIAHNGPAVCAGCRSIAVARVFALVVRWRIMLLIVYSRVGKNRDTKGGGLDSGNRKVYTLMFVPLARRQLHIPTCYVQAFIFIYHSYRLYKLRENLINR
jgi:hypothetical protein